MKRSIGFRAQFLVRTGGTAGRTGGRKAQWPRAFPHVPDGSSGHFAPWSIQARRVPTWSGVNGSPSGGIRSSGSRLATRRISSLSALWPGRMALRPSLPPRKAAAFSSRRRPAFCFFGPWQA